jgi:fructose-bisphosphate aldolase class II
MIKMEQMFRWADENNRALVAFNISNMETIQGITAACKKLNCSVILQVSKGARAYANPEYLRALFDAANGISPTGMNTGPSPGKVPFALHLDHGDSFELCKACIDQGFDSVMIDGSHLPFADNAALTKQVVNYAHSRGVWVEGELGQISGIEDNISAEQSHYTDPAAAAEFVRLTGVDSLAVSIGTAHGAFKYKPGTIPKLRLDILKRIHKLLPNTPLVLHGASSVIPEYIDTINKYGGKIENALGIPEHEIAKTIKYGVKKINIDSDIRLGTTATVRQYFTDNPNEFDPRKYLGEARKTVEEIAARKLRYYTIKQ